MNTPDGNAERDVRAMLDVAERFEGEGEGFTPTDFNLEDSDDLDEALALWRRAQRQARAAKVIVQVCGEVVAGLLGEGGAARIGPDIVRYQVGRTERCIDPDGFSAYTTAAIINGDVRLGDVFNPSYAKRSWMPTAVRDTFYEWVADVEPSLKVIPVDKSPKYLQALSDGEATVKP